LVLVGCARSGSPAPVELHGYVPPDPPPLPAQKPPPPKHTPTRLAQAVVASDIASQSAPEPPSPRYTAPVRVTALPSPSARPPGAVTGSRGVHTAQRGDTVYRIARVYGVPIRALIDANRLQPPYQLILGQKVVIPQQRQHFVRSGDTVYGLSQRYGVDMAELVRLNAIGPPYKLRPGQHLFLPQSVRHEVVVAAAPETVSPVPEPQSDRVVPQLSDGTTKATAAAKLAAIPTPPPRSGAKFFWPVSGEIISAFGPQSGGLHNDGINIAAPRGALVHAADNGVVAYAGSELRGFGNLVLLKHADGWITAYAHNDELLVQQGDTVRRTQPIARVGSSGNVASPQLHFEIRQGTRAVDPRQLLGPQEAAG
jgi:murein DD-endopeptidase MepM/ murein hydrolase activator NlpD